MCDVDENALYILKYCKLDVYLKLFAKNRGFWVVYSENTIVLGTDTSSIFWLYVVEKCWMIYKKFYENILWVCEKYMWIVWNER